MRLDLSPPTFFLPPPQVLPPGLARSMLHSMPLKKVPGLGGKLGDQLEEALGKVGANDRGGRRRDASDKDKAAARVFDVLAMEVCSSSPSFLL